VPENKYVKYTSKRLKLVNYDIMRLHNIATLLGFAPFHAKTSAVITSSGPNLEIPCGELKSMSKPLPSSGDTPTPIRTLAEAERDHIIEALHQSGGVVAGRNGARPARPGPYDVAISDAQTWYHPGKSHSG